MRIDVFTIFPPMVEGFAGLSLLGALWALLIALGTAILFVVAWPLRKMIRRRRVRRMISPWRASVAE